MIELVSIIVLVFALTLVILGVVTMWLERNRKRLLGWALALMGAMIGSGYSFLGSRFSLALFDRLIVRVDLPALMAAALTYTVGVLSGASLAAAVFLWVTGRFRHHVGRTSAALIAGSILVALVTTLIAVALSGP